MDLSPVSSLKTPARSPAEFFAGRCFPTELIAQKAWVVYQRAANSKGLIIGFGDDVVKYGARDGWDILALSEKALKLAKGKEEWWYINKAWLDGAIDAGVRVRLISRGDDVAEQLLLALKEEVPGRGVVREIRYLILRGHPFTLGQ